MTFIPTIPSSTGEDIVKHWGEETFGISYKDKTILDLGASNGDSAEYLIFCGAKLVIAVEGYEKFKDLEENSKRFDNKIIPIHLFISSLEEIEKLILQYKPDIIKCDIEGAEINLLNISNDIWKTVPEYIVETHQNYGFIPTQALRDKCIKNNYIIVKDLPIFNNIIYAKRES